jgi:hypothetical protein
MGFRFQRRIRILPGFRVNISKSGVSESIGRRGAWFTIGPRGTRSTVGLPGSGLSYTSQSSARSGHVGRGGGVRDSGAHRRRRAGVRVALARSV